MEENYFREVKEYVRLVEEEIQAIEGLEEFICDGCNKNINWAKKDYETKKKTLAQLIDNVPEIVKILEKELEVIKQRWCI